MEILITSNPIIIQIQKNIREKVEKPNNPKHNY